MTTLATRVDWIATATGKEKASEAATRDGSNPEFRVRAFPNEEIYLWVKEVDNSRVVPRANPKETGACWRFIGSACLGVVLLVGVLVPIAYNLLGGYQIHGLEKQRETLLQERSELELREARLVNPARLAELARIQQLVDPAPETAVSLSPVPDASLARNR